MDSQKKKPVKVTEVRDVIHGSLTFFPWEMAVIDSAAFQRLRNIKQLGFSEFAYPCAVHNRYIHSIGACHLAGHAFLSIFKDHFFSSKEVFEKFQFLARVAALLHDIGHGPFSHAIEEFMPNVGALRLPEEVTGKNLKRQANHEDYTLKIILDSSLTEVIEKNYARFGITPRHIACVMNLALKEPDNFFVDKGVSFRKILHQIISSEIDVDRMDYLQRDSYFAGVSYGKFDANWLLSHLGFHVENKTAHLTLAERAIYTFEDFLLSRYHMFLMVYLHHKSICYEKMMNQYLNSKDCSFTVPADIEEYLRCDDSVVYTHLRKDSATNEWARRILGRRTYKVALEIHDSQKSPDHDPRVKELEAKLKAKGVHYFKSNTGRGLSNYVRPNLGSVAPGPKKEVDENTIFVERNDRMSDMPHVPLEHFTDLFRRYGQALNILRIYVPENAKF